MNKSFTRLGVFLFSLLGLLILSCGSSPLEEEEQDLDSQKNTKSTQGNKDSIKKTREEAFAEVVKALHAPYNSGDKFFRIFTGSSEINETKEGSAISVKDGDSSITGKGTWTVKAGKDNEQGKDKEDSIVYTYTGFQPQGSKIVIDGKMISMYRSKELNGGFGYGGGGAAGENKDAIGFHKNGIVLNNGDQVEVGVNGVKAIEESTTSQGSYLITLADVLTISGEYQAKLEFIYTYGGIHSDVGDSNYEAKLIGDDQGMFTVAGSSIEFTYNGETKELTTEQIKKLIIVS